MSAASLARLAVGVYLLAVVALLIDLTSFCRLGALCVALGVEAVARSTEEMA